MDVAKIISIYFFQIIIFIAFYKVVFSKCSGKKELRTIIDGLAIFIVAIIANHPAVYTLSLFIGGLIIASEEFLKFIFAIWKSSPDKIGEVVQSLSEPSSEELDKKKQSELNDVTGDNYKESKDINNLKQKYFIVEKQVNKHFKDKYGGFYKTNKKIQNRYGSMIFDGVISNNTNPKDFFTDEELRGRNDLEANKAVEIKFFNNKNQIEKSIQKLVEKISFYNFILLYEIVIVVENLSREDVKDIYSRISEKYSESIQFKFYIASFENNKVEFFDFE